MSWAGLLWLPPVMLAVALVLGTAGRTGARVIARSVWHTFFALTLGICAVGVCIHLIARLFS